jgi:hypothetical protein
VPKNAIDKLVEKRIESLRTKLKKLNSLTMDMLALWKDEQQQRNYRDLKMIVDAYCAAEKERRLCHAELDELQQVDESPMITFSFLSDDEQTDQILREFKTNQAISN